MQESAVPAQAIMAMAKDEALKRRRASSIRNPPNRIVPADNGQGALCYTTARKFFHNVPNFFPRSSTRVVFALQSQYATRERGHSQRGEQHGRRNSQPGTSRHH